MFHRLLQACTGGNIRKFTVDQQEQVVLIVFTLVDITA